jgi:hypothetical protein
MRAAALDRREGADVVAGRLALRYDRQADTLWLSDGLS